MNTLHARLGYAVLACTVSVLFATPAAAQLRGQRYVGGLTAPVGFIQDPSNPGVQYVIEQGGIIRVIQNGVLLPTPFLSLGGVLSGGERGLLGLAFPPDYGTSGRFYVDFTRSPDGNTVIARFERSGDNPLVAEPDSRFDLKWSTGLTYIQDPAPNHNGGNLEFGPDGYLYLAWGDGGGANDQYMNAQNPDSLLGKMLRINVNVPDNDPEGFDIPPGNPFSASSRPEIWAFGLRNPWRWSFDQPSRGGTGAIYIGDVGQGSFEEIDYQPPGVGGRNYGWPSREGAHNFNTNDPPAFFPLVDPFFEYGRSSGQATTGGFVYRGSNLPSMYGRYVFADYQSGRIWSVAITIGPNGEATASDGREHTGEVRAGFNTGNISSFGVDSLGELYIVAYGGAIVLITPRQPPTPLVNVDVPMAGWHRRQPFQLSGWALDATAPDQGISSLHVWAIAANGATRFLGLANNGGSRPDVAAVHGSQFAQSGFNLLVKGLSPGNWQIWVFALVTATGTFTAGTPVPVVIDPSGLMSIDTPGPSATVTRPFTIGGWAVDTAALSGTGVDAVHGWAFRVGPAGTVFLGSTGFGNRPDVAAVFGQQFLASGFGLVVNAGTLPAGTWDIIMYGHSTVSGAFDFARTVRVTVQ